MTDPKPLTAEELDEKLELVQSGTPLLMATQVRLIAQAREEIRLREENARLCVGLKAAVRDVVDRASLQLQAQNEILDEALKQTNLLVPDQCVDIHGQHYGIASCREVLLALKAETGAPEDPAARAKRELGVWLVSPDGQGFSVTIKDRGPTWISQERWRCVLRGHTSTFTRCEPTEHEAITAALRAAKGSGR